MGRFGLGLTLVAPLLGGQRGDLTDYAPAVTWGLTALQSLAGLGLLALGFREAVPGRNASRGALLLATTLTALVLVGIAVVTPVASGSIVPVDRRWQYWSECVRWPMAIGAPFMVLATLMTARAFPTRPALAGGLCGLAAGVLADAGWRLSCWFSEPGHIGAHALAVSGLTVAGAILAAALDSLRWRRRRRTLQRRADVARR